MATVQFSSVWSEADPSERPVVIVGQVHNLKKVSWDSVRGKLHPRVTPETFKEAVSSLHPSPTDSCSLWLNNATVAALPNKASRHNTPAHPHALTKLVRSCMAGCREECIVLVCEKSEVFAAGCAVSRVFPCFTRKSGATQRRKIVVEFVLVDDGENKTISEDEASCLQAACDAVRLSAKIVDTPCNEMNTDDFLNEIQTVGSQVGITPVVIRGEELRQRGFGGIYGVGQAADHPPALAILSHKPTGATQTVAWVGKGIVYDTGGLSIKGKTAMPGMKRDCGGAAAILGAFCAAIQQGFQDNLHAVFCLAENAVGPLATRPDDIHKLYSGRTVEINNTDAEGRLVLGDGVAYAAKDLQADIIVDMATLTGAQGISVGKYHAAILTNNEQWEQACVTAGRKSGDLVHPLPYCPELHFSEFNSAVADMKNSVADRNNAQSSCAGLFIGAHLGFDWPGVWLHIDMAAPAHAGERATGYGVALLLALFGRASETDLLQAVSPLGPVQDRQENACKKRKLGERATGYGVALLLALFGRASETDLLQAVSPLGPVQDRQENACKKRKLV